MSAPGYDAAAVRARLVERLSELGAVVGTLRAQEQASAASEAERAAAFAAKARSGALGPAWRRVQERIDLKQTTLADVMSGADESREAAELRRLAGERLATVRKDLEEERETEPRGNPLAELEEAQQQLARRADDLRRRLGGFGG